MMNYIDVGWIDDGIVAIIFTDNYLVIEVFYVLLGSCCFSIVKHATSLIMRY